MIIIRELKWPELNISGTVKNDGGIKKLKTD